MDDPPATATHPCPDCGTEYAVTAADAGRRIACTKCAAVLLVGPDGLTREAAAPPPSSQRDRLLSPAAWQRLAERFDLPTVLFGVGAVFTLAFVLMPEIGKAKVARRAALQQEEQFDHEQEVKRLREKSTDPVAIRQAEEKWTQRREVLAAESKAAEFAAAKGGYGDRYGLLLGLTLVAVGALAMMRGDGGLVKRVFAASVLGVLLALAFASALGGCGRWPAA